MDDRPAREIEDLRERAERAERERDQAQREHDRLRFAFWAINIGLMAMVLISLLPVGLMQTWASVEHGYWYARSPEFLQQGLINQLRWMRVIGDTIFAVGCLALVWFVFGLSTGHSYGPETNSSTESVPGQPPAYLPAR